MAIKINLTDAIEKSRHSKRIGRSIVFTVCNGSFYANGEHDDFSDTLIGKWSAKRATSYFRKLYGDTSITIFNTEVFKQYCEMELLDFWLNARATGDPVKVSETTL